MPTLTCIVGQGNNECGWVEKVDSGYSKYNSCQTEPRAGQQPGGTGGQTVGRRCWFYFDISALPAEANVTKVEFKHKVTTAGGAAGEWNFSSYGWMGGNRYPCDDPALSCFARCTDGGYPQYRYVDKSTNPRSIGTYTETLGASETDQACTDVEDSRDNSWGFPVGCWEEGDDDDECVFDGCQSGYTYAPRVAITYEIVSEGYSYGDSLVQVSIFAFMRQVILSVCSKGACTH